VTLLEDPDPVVRSAVAGLLMDVGDASVSDELMGLAKEYPEAAVRLAAIWALGRIGDSKAMDMLAALANSDPASDEEGRRVDTAAREAIAEIRSREAMGDAIKDVCGSAGKECGNSGVSGTN